MGDITEHVTHSGKGKSRSTICNYCKIVLKVPAKLRWEQNMRSCVSCPVSIKKSFPPPKQQSKSVVVIPQEPHSIHSNNTSNLQRDLSHNQVSIENNHKVTGWIDRMSAEEQERLDTSYSNMFYSTGIPFALANSAAMKSFLKEIRPSWEPPSAYRIGNSLLDKAYDVFEQCKANLLQQNTQFCLVSDGWSNTNNEHLVNFLAVFPANNQSPILLKTINTSGEEQSSVNIAKEIDSVIIEYGIDLVVGLVTDNAPNMRGAWELLETKYIGFICNGCGAHTFNLLVKDICKLDDYQPTLTAARAITSFVKKRAAIVNKYRSIQKHLFDENEIGAQTTLDYVGDTRWYTHYSCLRKIKDNKKVLKALVEKDVVIKLAGKSKLKKEQFVKDINNSEYWKQLDTIEEILKPTSEYIGNDN